jgi:hypothetical protein
MDSEMGHVNKEDVYARAPYMQAETTEKMGLGGKTSGDTSTGCLVCWD